MKAFRLIGMALVAICLCMNFASCSNEDVVSPEDPQEEKYVTVGLGCTGEFLEFSDSPLSRNATDELYGIQVYALTEDGTWEDETGEIHTMYTSTPYAYVLFTSLDDVKIRLLQGQMYNFDVSIVIEPWKNGCYNWFNFYDSQTTGTEFIYSASNAISPSSIANWLYQHNHDRYYGELDKYTPEENGSVEINTKRVAYGVKYEAIGLNDGESLTIEVNKYESNLYNVQLGKETYESIYTFNAIVSTWNYACRNELYTSSKKLTITWNKADGTVLPMGTYAVTFKRNVMTTIKINAENLNMDNGIKVYKEEVSMANDENEYVINGGTVTEVPVIPGN